jgi:hypothetical protein
LVTAGVIGADLDDVIAATSLISGPHRLDPSALPPWPIPQSPHRAAGPGRTGGGDRLGGSGGADRPGEVRREDRPDRGLGSRRWRVAYRSTLGAVECEAGVDRVVRERLVGVEVVDVPLKLAPTEDAWLPLSGLDNGRGITAEAADRARDAGTTTTLHWQTSSVRSMCSSPRPR